MGTSEFNAGGNPAMDWHPIQGGVEILLVASCYGNCSGLMGYLACIQTKPIAHQKNIAQPEGEKKNNAPENCPRKKIMVCP